MQFSRLTPLIASAVAALPPTAAYSNSVHISAPNLVPHGASQIIDHAFASFSFPAHWFADFTGKITHYVVFRKLSDVKVRR